MKVPRVKTFVSTNAELLDKKVNNFLEKIWAEDRWRGMIDVRPLMSVASVGDPKKALSPAYFVGCQIIYLEEAEVETQMDIFEGGEF